MGFLTFPIFQEDLPFFISFIFILSIISFIYFLYKIFLTGINLLLINISSIFFIFVSIILCIRDYI